MEYIISATAISSEINLEDQEAFLLMWAYILDEIRIQLILLVKPIE